MEILIAAILPVMAAQALTRWLPAPDRRTLQLLALIPLLWFAPCWLTGRSPVGFDFISQQEPWKALRTPQYLDRNPLLNDVPLQVVPFREEVRRAFLRFELPQLSSTLGGQTPLLANLQTAPFYPLNFVSIAFSSFAWPLFSMVAKMLAALFGTFLFLRRLGRSTEAAAIGAIAYGCGAFTVAWLSFPMTNVTVLLPLLLYAIDGIAESQSRHRVAFAGAVLGAMLLGGHPESVLHCAFVAIPYAIIRSGRAKARFALAAIAFGVTAMLIASIVLVPFFLYLPHSQRMVDIESSAGFLSSAPLGFDSLVPMLIPNYFGNPRAHNYRHEANFNELATGFAGLLTLVLAIVTLIVELRARRMLFAIIPIGFLAYPTSLSIFVTSRIPLLDITAHGRLRFVITLLLAILASRGIDLLRTEVHSRRIARFVAAATGILVLLIVAFSYPEFARVGIRRLILASELSALAGCALLLVIPEKTRWIPLVLLLDLFSVVGLYNPALGREWFYPLNEQLRRATAASALRSGSRVTGVGLALHPNTATMAGLAEVRPHDPLAFAPYVRFLEVAGLQRSSYFAQFEQMPSAAVLNFLGVSAVFTDLPGLPQIRKTAQARFFIPREIRTSDDPASAFSAAGDSGIAFSDIARSTPASATIRNLRFTATSRTFETEASGDAFVASSEVSLPGWCLEIDGTPAPIVNVNGPFIGFHLPVGPHRISLEYSTPGAVAGGVLSIAGLLILALLAAGGSRSRRGWQPRAHDDEPSSLEQR